MRYGKEYSITELAEIMLNLQDRKAHNINLVTGNHYIPQIIEAIEIAKREDSQYLLFITQADMILRTH